MPRDDLIKEQALAWAVKTDDPAFDEWEAFTSWLEQDPAHAEAYDAVCAAVADAEEAVKAIPAVANDNPPEGPQISRRRFGGLLAACLCVVLVAGVWLARDRTETFEAAPGETRSIALADGGTIELAGGSRLVLDGGDARFARLEQGQALFTINHDEANPFRVEVGEFTLIDAGTVFDVRTNAGTMSVAVGEGEVIFNPSAQAVSLHPGDMLSSTSGSDAYALVRIAPEQVGEWSEGRLTFQQAPLAEVAADLSRMTGVRYRAAPGSAVRPISGSLLIAPLKGDPRTLGPMLGVTVEPSGDGWMIEAQ